MSFIDCLFQHQVVTIGDTWSLDGLEVIADDWKGFVLSIFESEYYISTIRFYEYTSVNSKATFGGGGPLDPRSNGEFYFAETLVEKTFLFPCNACDYIRYIERSICAFDSAKVYPSFTIYKK